jgi:hypothetical protein
MFSDGPGRSPDSEHHLRKPDRRRANKAGVQPTGVDRGLRGVLRGCCYPSLATSSTRVRRGFALRYGAPADPWLKAI